MSGFQDRHHVTNAAPSLFEAAGSAIPVSTVSMPRGRGIADHKEPAAEVRFAVLSSSSAGNSSVIVVGSGDAYRLILIDAGLSPRRTAALLATIGLDSKRIDHVVLTHFHRDHIHTTWTRALARRVTTWVPRPHLRWAERVGLTRTRTEVIEPDGASTKTISRGITVSARMAPHDGMGSAVFRFEIPAHSKTVSLGYATDLGEVPEGMDEFLAGCTILALESNYDPHLQVSSGRHRVLVDRVMGGRGHLSNQQSALLSSSSPPTNQLVLLHLSRQCNTPEHAIAAHSHAVDCEVIASYHDRVCGPFELVSSESTASTSDSAAMESDQTTA